MARHPKSFVTLDGADHMLTSKNDAFYAGQIIASWVQRYVTFSKREKLRTEQQVIVKLSSEDIFKADIQVGRHGFVADEPEEIEGNDFGPDPYELLNSALGACTAMTLQIYAKLKKCDLQDVKVHLSHTKTIYYYEDNQDINAKTSKIDRFERVIELIGDLSTNQRQKLMAIANKCPVHRTLATPQIFATRLSEETEWKIEKGN